MTQWDKVTQRWIPDLNQIPLFSRVQALRYLQHWPGTVLHCIYICPPRRIGKTVCSFMGSQDIADLVCNKYLKFWCLEMKVYKRKKLSSLPGLFAAWRPVQCCESPIRFPCVDRKRPVGKVSAPELTWIWLTAGLCSVTSNYCTDKSESDEVVLEKNYGKIKPKQKPKKYCPVWCFTSPAISKGETETLYPASLWLDMKKTKK